MSDMNQIGMHVVALTLKGSHPWEGLEKRMELQLPTRDGTRASKATRTACGSGRTCSPASTADLSGYPAIIASKAMERALCAAGIGEAVQRLQVLTKLFNVQMLLPFAGDRSHQGFLTRLAPGQNRRACAAGNGGIRFTKPFAFPTVFAPAPTR